ncbi:MAG TPA: response regulator [Blastocatellia bacterium]|nr:response regulator [Blastocatellia bacterium]
MKSKSKAVKANDKQRTDRRIRKHVLCVDSDENTCKVMATLLAGSGYEVTHTTTIADGLNLARRRSFDLLLLDWQLKDGTGVELCQMIRTFNSQIPILFYSAKADDSDAKSAISAGAQGCLVKPVEVMNLLQTISHYMVARDGEAQKPRS